MIGIQIRDPHALKPERCAFTLTRGETRRLASSVRRITVEQGCAWLSVGPQDILVKPGEHYDLGLASARPMLLTAMGHIPLVLHVA